MCTTITDEVALEGEAKGASGWFRIERAYVGYDHPSAAPLEHAVLVDVLGSRDGATTRLALELDRASAAALAEQLLDTLRQAASYEGEGAPAA